MKVRTLLNKLKLNDNQYIKVLDEKIEYCIQGFDKQLILDDCARSSVINFQYIQDYFLININKKK